MSWWAPPSTAKEGKPVREGAFRGQEFWKADAPYSSMGAIKLCNHIVHPTFGNSSTLNGLRVASSFGCFSQGVDFFLNFGINSG
jgi:hypothetical protein